MLSQRTPAAPLASRRHADLLLHLVQSGDGASVKDLRLRRVIPPASSAAAKPGSVESTPPEAAAAEDRELKPMLPRSKLVRDPASFGYRRLLPFLNEMAKNDNSENTAENSEKELNRSYFGLVDESVDGSHGEADNTTDSVEPIVVKTRGGQEMKDCCNIVKDETNTAHDDLSCSKPWLTRCPRSRFVHHPSSFSYKRMLPFLMENELSSQEGERVKIQRVIEEKQLVSDDNDFLASGQHQLAVSEKSPEENNRAQVGRTQEDALKSDGNSICDGRQFQPVVSKVSPPEGGAAKMQKATQKQALTPGGGEGNPLTSDKGEFLARDQPQLRVTEEMLKDNAELAGVQHCQRSESGCCDVGFVSPTKTVVPLVNRHSAPERQDPVASLDDPLPDVGMIFRPSDPCAVGTPLFVEEMSSGVMHAESGLSKVGTLRPRGSPCSEKRGLSPKKLSPKKGILKSHTRGCKGICMCLDCSIFRLRADRAFEFSRKQMQEADDIIGNLLKEVASLRDLMEKSTGQEPTQAACRRASRIEEVARERRRQMLMELNSHCRIPGPRVKFAQYVEEKMGASPRSGNRR